MKNQKINFIKNVKKIIVNLTTNKVEQIEEILLKIIGMLKVNLEEKIENFSKLI